MKKNVRKFVRTALCPYYLVAAVLSVLVIVLVCQTVAYSKTGKAQAVQLSSATTMPEINYAGNITESLEMSQPLEKFKEVTFSALSELVDDVQLEDVDFIQPSFDNEEYNDEQESAKWKTVRMRVTGYCPCEKCCGKHSDGKTANMHKIKWGDRFVAAPKGYKFGTEMIVPGYNSDGKVKVYDRGRAIYGNRLDVFFNTHYSAKKWGSRYLDVKVKVR